LHKGKLNQLILRRPERYQRGNLNPHIEEKQTKCPKEKGQTTIYKAYM
jgi:hypothetical protein